MRQREIQILFVSQENTVQGRRGRYTMQSSITNVCLSHAACTEQKSPQENTCTCTTVYTCKSILYEFSLTPAENLIFAVFQWLKFFLLYTSVTVTSLFCVVTQA